jgi:hypothetical protein
MAKHFSLEEILTSPLVYDDGAETDKAVIRKCNRQLRYWNKVRELLIRRPGVPVAEIHRQAKSDLAS